MISVIIVNWNGGDIIMRCIDSLANKKDLELIVVDNDSTDKSIDNLKKCNYNNLRIIENDKNLGFGTACNIGAKAASGNIIVFLNPDAFISYDNIFQLSAVCMQKSLCILAPMVYEERYGTARTAAYFPTITRKLFGGIASRVADVYKWNVPSSILMSYPSSYYNGKELVAVDWVIGACMMMRKDIFLKLGGFDEKIFLYAEETDLCRRAWQLSIPCYVVTSLHVDHTGGGLAGRTLTRRTAYLRVQSEYYYFEKHHGKLYAIFYIYTYLLSSLLKAVLLTPFNRLKASDHYMIFRGACSFLFKKN